MTVSASVGRQFTIDQHVARSYRTAGLIMSRETPTLEQLQEGREFLEVIIDALANHGVFAKALMFVELPLVDGTRIYELDSAVQEVRGNAMLIQADQVGAAPNYGSGEVQINQSTSAAWHMLSDKTAEGQPQQFWIDRQPDGPVKASFWPVPDATMDGAVVRFQVERHLADCDDGSATLDVEPCWNKYLLYELATMLAEAASRPGEKIAWLKTQSQNELPLAMSKATASSLGQLVYCHGGDR